VASYIQVYNLQAESSAILARSTVAITKYARYLLGASQDATLLAWARTAIRDPGAMARTMLFAIVSDSAIADAADPDAVTDGQVQTIVETLVNAEFKNL